MKEFIHSSRNISVQVPDNLSYYFNEDGTTCEFTVIKYGMVRYVDEEVWKKRSDGYSFPPWSVDNSRHTDHTLFFKKGGGYLIIFVTDSRRTI